MEFLDLKGMYRILEKKCKALLLMRLSQTGWQAKIQNIGEVNRDIWFEIPRAVCPLV
jgi:hypothetical protein